MAQLQYSSADRVHFGEGGSLEDLDAYLQQRARVQPLLAGKDEPDGTSECGDSGIEGSEVEGLSEQGDKAPQPLVEGFPRFLNRPKRIRSCELTKVSSRCVAKATQHLELVQNVIEDWYERKEEEVRSRLTTAMSERPTTNQTTRTPSAPGQRQTLRFQRLQPLTPENARGSVRPRSGASPELSVLGVGAAKSEAGSTEKEELPDEIPSLGAEDVLEEVVLLLGRLESDRLDAEASWRRERERVKNLRTKIDDLAMQRLLELPKAVQNEHEACIRDISELQWHLNYRQRGHGKIKSKTETAETLNGRLKEEIAFVRKHVPLMKEKLELENEAMDRIVKAKNITAGELEQTQGRCDDAQDKNSQAQAKADQEREVIKRDLETVNSELAAINEELAEAKKSFNTQSRAILDTRNKLVDNKRELQVLKVKDENAKAAEAMQEVKVAELRKRIYKEEATQRELENEIQELDKELNIMMSTYEQEHLELDRAIDRLESKARTALSHIEAKELDSRDLTAKINDCERQRVADEKNVTRIKKEMIRVDEQMEMTTEEHVKVSLINQSIHDTLKTETEKATVAEEGLKNTAEQLRRQVRDEVHNRAMIQARMTSEGDEHEKESNILGKRQEKMDVVVKELTFTVKVVEDKVVTLREEKQEREQRMEELESSLKHFRAETLRLDKEGKERLASLRPEHYRFTDALMKKTKRVEHIVETTKLIEEKLSEYSDQGVAMDKSVKKINVVIVKLKEELDELELQIEAQKKVELGLKGNLDGVMGRLTEALRKHREHMEARKDVLRGIERDLTKNMEGNTELASRYRRLQQEFLYKKSLLMNDIDDRVKLENKAKDVHQVLGLQQRMHAALEEYFKIRGRYNQQELAVMEDRSSQNAHKVRNLQSDMEGALTTISEFLTAELTKSEPSKPVDPGPGASGARGLGEGPPGSSQKPQVEGETARKSAMAMVQREETLFRQKTMSRQPTGLTLAT